jgi:hypothetical protein
MPERPRRPDYDERFSLYPESAEDVLGAEDVPMEEDEPRGDVDS